jgi:hypothetical protein
VCRTSQVERSQASWSWRQPSTTVFQKGVVGNGGSSGTVDTESSGVVAREIGLCFFHVSKSGRALDLVVSGFGGGRGVIVDDGGARGVVDVVVAVVAYMLWGGVVDSVGDGPGITVFFGVKVPVRSSGRRASSHRANVSG